MVLQTWDVQALQNMVLPSRQLLMRLLAQMGSKVLVWRVQASHLNSLFEGQLEIHMATTIGGTLLTAAPVKSGIGTAVDLQTLFPTFGLLQTVQDVGDVLEAEAVWWADYGSAAVIGQVAVSKAAAYGSLGGVTSALQIQFSKARCRAEGVSGLNYSSNEYNNKAVIISEGRINADGTLSAPTVAGATFQGESKVPLHYNKAVIHSYGATQYIQRNW